MRGALTAALLTGVQAVVQAGYQLLDRFITNHGSPLPSPRTAEPGPGALTLVQNDGAFSVSGGALNFLAQVSPAWTDQGFYGGGVSRVTGRALLVDYNISTGGDIFLLAWARTGTINFGGWANQALAVYVDSARGVRVASNAGAGVSPLVSITRTVTYSLAVVLRSIGACVLIKGGSWTNWTLLWVAPLDNTATIYPAFSNGSAAGTLDNFRVIDLPSPFSSDTGLATSVMSGARADGDTYAHEANALIEYTVTARGTSGDGVLMIFRKQDATNFWSFEVWADGSAVLVETVNGTRTARGSAAANSVQVGQRYVIVTESSTVKIFVNDVLIISYSSASNFVTMTSAQVTLHHSAGCSDIIVWPRTLSGAARAWLNAA